MTTTLDHQMRVVLLRLELISHAAITAYNPSGGQSGEPDDKTVMLILRHDDPPHLTYRTEYNAQTNDHDRTTVIARATEELESWVKRTAPKVEQTKSFEECVIEDGVGFDPVLVAGRFGVEPARIRRIRQRHQLKTEDGLPRDTARLPSAERVERARMLRDRGLSLRQIGLHLNVGVATVKRDLAA